MRSTSTALGFVFGWIFLAGLGAKVKRDWAKAVSYRREKTLDLDLEFGVKLVRLNFSLGSPYIVVNPNLELEIVQVR